MPSLQKERINFCFLLKCRRHRNKLQCRRNQDSLQCTIYAVSSFSQMREQTYYSAQCRSGRHGTNGPTSLSKRKEHFCISSYQLRYDHKNRLYLIGGQFRDQLVQASEVFRPFCLKDHVDVSSKWKITLLC